MAQPLENTGAGDGTRTRDLRRDRPNDTPDSSTDVGNSSAQERAAIATDSQPTYASATLTDRYGAGVEKTDTPSPSRDTPGGEASRGEAGGLVVIDWIEGACPVQAEGSVDGKRFYFRARGEHWSFKVSSATSGDYLTWPDSDNCFFHEEEWGDGPYEAGWMSVEVARSLIAKAADIYRAKAAPPTQQESGR